MELNRNEIHRLKRALKDKDDNKILEWADQFRNQVDAEYNRKYQKAVDDALTLIEIALVYTLHYCEDTNLDADGLPSFMEDFMVSIDMFRTGEYKPEEYVEELKKCGIDITDELKTYRENHPGEELK